MMPIHKSDDSDHIAYLDSVKAIRIRKSLRKTNYFRQLAVNITVASMSLFLRSGCPDGYRAVEQDIHLGETGQDHISSVARDHE
jgi:hypothetical protein